MSKTKVYRVSHLNAQQGACEKLPEAYSTYVEEASQQSNTAVRQKHRQRNSQWQLAGGRDG